MTPEEFKDKISREKTNAYMEAVKVFPKAVDLLEKRLISRNKIKEDTSYVSSYFSMYELNVYESLSYKPLTQALKEYFQAQGWLVSLQTGPHGRYCLHLYVDTKKHRFYVWLRNNFNSTFSEDY